MMKKIYYILFLLLAGFCFNSCVMKKRTYLISRQLKG